MAEQYFTRPNIEKVIGKLGTTPEQRGLSTQEFKDKFDEMPEAIQQYIKETLLTELDTFLADYESFKGIAGQWIRIDNLSAPIQIPTGGTESQIYVPLSENISLTTTKIYAVEFMISDQRNANISIFTTPTNSGAGIIVGVNSAREIVTAMRGRDSTNSKMLRFYGVSSDTQPSYVARVFRLKDGEL